MAAPTQTAVYDPGQSVRDFYLHSLELMDRSGAPYVVGGGYAMACYTGIVRPTKDLDVFIKRENAGKVLGVFAEAGYRTERTWPHFLVKAIAPDGAFVDLLYSSANGLCEVDDAMLARPVHQDMLGRVAPLCPVEDMIWSKAFVASRDRFDGADIMHLILSQSERIDWKRLRNRFRGHERVLLAHLIMFDYVYPAERSRVPRRIISELMSAARNEPAADEPICRGTFLSNNQYVFDVTRRGYRDARLAPGGPMTPDEVATISPIEPAR
ncbi:MAG TPA: hypothetical protein VLJ39_14445 [Tepidisphaeraceae bacterium]|nr:hypothetical protein [Tepidisphaeraceae bacterium]